MSFIEFFIDLCNRTDLEDSEDEESLRYSRKPFSIPRNESDIEDRTNSWYWSKRR